MPIFTNIDQVAQWMQESIAGVNFEMPADGAQLGGVCAREISTGIQERSWEQQKGATQDWPENSEPYKTRKQRRYGTDKTNYRTRQMISDGSIEANVTVEDDGKVVKMKYGTGLPPTDAAEGELTDQDRRVTDTQKAEWAHAQGRPFFELDQEMDNQRIMPILKRAFEQYLTQRANS